MERLKQKRAAVRSQVTKLLAETDAYIESQEKNEKHLKVLLARISAIQAQLNEADAAIEPRIPDEEAEQNFARTLEYGDKIVTYIAMLKQEINDARENRPPRTETTPSQQNEKAGAPPCKVKLPKLDLLKFDGKSVSWQEFWEQFDQVINANSELTVLDKFGYLKAAVTGDAASVIKGLPPTARCYEDALELLKSRFGDEEGLIQAHMRKLLSVPPVRSADDVRGLRRLYDTLLSHIRGLEALGQNQNTFEALLFPVVQRSLPKEILLDFNRTTAKEQAAESSVQQTLLHEATLVTEDAHEKSSEKSATKGATVSSLSRLIAFLRIEVKSREGLEVQPNVDAKPHLPGTKNDHKNVYKPHKGGNPKSSVATLHQTTKTGACFFCTEKSHETAACCAEIKLEEKKKRLMAGRRCFRCTRPNHRSNVCRSNVKCAKCSKRHATTMCDPEFTAPKAPLSTSSVTTAPVNLESTTNEAARPVVLLQTATVHCAGADNATSLRALFDGGSQRSFITKRASKKLGCKVVGYEALKVGVFGGSQSERDFKRVLVSVTAQNKKVHHLEVLETEVICDQKVPIPEAHLRDLMGSEAVADRTGDQDQGDIDLLIGSEHYWDLVTGRSKALDGKLRAVETAFGWCIQGPVGTRVREAQCMQTIALKVSLDDSDASNYLERFWTLESIGVTDDVAGCPEQQLLDSFDENIKQVGSRYEVALPWKENIELKDNREVAEKRLVQLTNRLKKDPDLLQTYDDVIRQYCTEGVAEAVVEEDGSNGPIYYMPHQPVIREASDTTRVRVVFDASSHGNHAKSLNQNLESGPNLTTDLVGLLLNFRRHRIALVADIEKAFLQIGIREEDRDALRFLWFETAAETTELKPKVQAWRMTRVPFGTTASPFLLTATLKNHLRSMEGEYPVTARILADCLYVDDLLTGAENGEEALKIYTEANAIFNAASMKLHKWATNSKEVSEHISDGQESRHLGYLSGVLKVLGLTWNPISDELTFTPTTSAPPDPGTSTKRTVLKTTARLYDPLGWLTPFTVRAKALFQELWQRNVEWDAVLPQDLDTKWVQWCCELNELQRVHVQRCYRAATTGLPQKTLLHVFADASPVAYGAVAYICVTDAEGNTTSSILMGKSKIAPIKQLTLPRLELMACLLAARLGRYITNNLKERPQETYFWTDSTVALHWVTGEPSQWKQFVQNRVTEIQRITNPAFWKHCPGSGNPADCMTRGFSGQQLVESSLWWKGPEWMGLPENFWPNHSPPSNTSAATDEKRVPAVLQATSSTSQTVLDITRYSEAARLLRVTAWIMRYVHKLRHTSNESGSLTTRELDEAEKHWIRLAQREDLQREIECTQTGERFPADSPLRDIPVFMDNDGVLRITGRLQQSEKPYNEQHPIALTSGHRLAELIARRCHLQVLHGGVRDTLVQLREKFYVVRARQLVKRIIKGCMTCQRFNARPATEVIAPLPRDRVTEAQPFEVTGVDFAGPLLVKGESAMHKSYVTLFTCAVTRAVHLELVRDMSTESFLMALRRFISRRGIPRVIYSDNAMSFKRANKELSQLWKSLRHPATLDFISNARIEWKFIVERAPWWGGFYERLVGSTKLALKKVIGSRYLSFDELATVLSEVEAVLNSRPLTNLYDEAGEPEPLCPSLFLTGKRLTTLPSVGIKDDNIDDSLHKLWTRRQLAIKAFWRIWTKEYLAELRNLHNGKRRQGKILAVGDLVLLRDSQLPRQQWSLARIQKVFPGRDGKIRSCILRMPGGSTLKRPIQLVYPLEIT